ncbi:MAG: hypothetical protein ACFB10_19560 [Salibacteraceae bacterium]
MSQHKRLSTAIGLKTINNWYHELELSISGGLPPFEHTSYFTQSTGEFSGLMFNLHVETARKMAATNIMDLYLGTGLGGHLGGNEYDPESNLRYPVSDFHVGAVWSLIPRITIPLFSQFSMDFNVKMGLLQWDMVRSRVSNPVIPVKNQQRTTSKWRLLSSSHSVRLGLAYRLTGRKNEDR